MKFWKFLFLVTAVFLAAGCLKDGEKKERIETTVHVLTEEGRGKAVGTMVVEPGENGMIFRVKIKSPELEPGDRHPFHVHEFADFGSSLDDTGEVIVAGAAGDHWDPDNTGKHAGPDGDGHRGDLPFLIVNEDGEIDMEVVARRIKTVSELKNKSAIIHVADGPERLFGAYLE